MPETPPFNAPAKPQIGSFQTVEWVNGFWRIRDMTASELRLRDGPAQSTSVNRAQRAINVEAQRRVGAIRASERALLNMKQIPRDYTDDKWWP